MTEFEESLPKYWGDACHNNGHVNQEGQTLRYKHDKMCVACQQRMKEYVHKMFSGRIQYGRA